MKIEKYYELSWYDIAINKLKELVPGGKGKVVYDIGAGNNILKNRVEEHGAEWVGFDYIPRQDFIHKWNVETETVDRTDRPDVIFFLEVIEHLHNPGFAIKHIAEAAKKGTHIVITTPNPFWSINRIKFFLLGFFPNFTEEDMNNNHHVFTVWPYVLEKLLKENGFAIKDTYTLMCKASFPKFTINPIFFVKIVYYLVRKFIETIDKKSIGQSYGVVAEKV